MIPGGSTIIVGASYFSDSSNPCCSCLSNQLCTSCASDYACAWPNLSTYPNEPNTISTYCGVSFSCGGSLTAGTIPQLACGDLITVRSQCTLNELTVTIDDHGPGVCVCDSGCGYSDVMRVVDLSEAAFQYIAGSLNTGHTIVEVQY